MYVTYAFWGGLLCVEVQILEQTSLFVKQMRVYEHFPTDTVVLRVLASLRICFLNQTIIMIIHHG